MSVHATDDQRTDSEGRAGSASSVVWSTAGDSVVRRVSYFAVGIVSYLLTFASLVYAVGFVSGLGVPKTVDRGASLLGDAVASPAAAVAVNLALLGLFALQHSVMARPAFKRAWTRIVPQPIERAVYCLASAAAFAAIFAFWQPLPGTLWNVVDPVARGLLFAGFFAGFGLVFYATFLIDHFDLFGVRHAVLALRGRGYTFHPFDTPSLYKVVRHPLYVGWLLFFWVTPTMTVGHLLLAGTVTAYILGAIQVEERDLVSHFGERYRRYREQVPMLVPRLRWRRRVPSRVRV